jgi:hypothetical protein
MIAFMVSGSSVAIGDSSRAVTALDNPIQSLWRIDYVAMALNTNSHR